MRSKAKSVRFVIIAKNFVNFECGNFAWKVYSSFPPRRVCFLSDAQDGDNQYCFPHAANLNAFDISATLNIGMDQVFDLRASSQRVDPVQYILQWQGRP
jgi:hypothetical protein